MANNKTFKIPRQVLMVVFNGDMQAVKAMENLQLSAFDLLPQDIQQIIETAAADAQQAAMIANQLRQEAMPYLSAVSVPISGDTPLQPVSLSRAHQEQLHAVSAPCECIDSLPAV